MSRAGGSPEVADVQPQETPARRRNPAAFRDAMLAMVDEGEVILYGDGELAVDVGDGWVSHKLSATDASVLGSALLLIAARRKAQGA